MPYHPYQGNLHRRRIGLASCLDIRGVLDLWQSGKPLHRVFVWRAEIQFDERAGPNEHILGSRCRKCRYSIGGGRLQIRKSEAVPKSFAADDIPR